MKLLNILVLIVTSTILYSGEHALGAHEHGHIKIEMAVENNSIEINIDGPSESFIGFEYLPKSTKEKKILSDAKTLWEKNIFTLFEFDKKLNCKLMESSLNQVIEENSKKEKKEAGVHSDIEAKTRINCSGPLANSKVKIQLKKHFKGIKKLVAEILSSKTTTIEITKDVQEVEL